MRAATSSLITAFATDDTVARPAPAWLSATIDALAHGTVSTRELAQTVGRHPAWLARAYRMFRGEGVQDARRRYRLERAVLMLRNSMRPLSEIAVQSGFCDQSHMNGTFRAMLNRTPIDVRGESTMLAAFAPQ